MDLSCGSYIQVNSKQPSKILPTDTLNLGLTLHNEYRKRHGCPPVTLDLQLCEEAQKYARCILTNGHLESEKELENLGRNIFRLWTQPDTYVNPNEIIKTAIDMWYKKREDYCWENPLISDKRSAAFTHCVWKSCSKIGIGFETIGTKTLVMALYWPPFNSFESDVVSDREYRENVLPVRSR